MQRAAILQQLELQQETIGTIFRRTPLPAQQKAQPGKWSMHDQLAHLARYQLVFEERINAMLTHDVPAFPRYAAENDPEFSSWQERSSEELLRQFKTQREKLLATIAALTEEELSREALHPAYGRMPLRTWLEFFTLHEAHHAYSIFQLSQLNRQEAV